MTEDRFSHKCCIRCIYWHNEYCYRFPPTPCWNDASGRDHFARYPVVAPANGCGEWKGVTKQILQDRMDWITQEREDEYANRD